MRYSCGTVDVSRVKCFRHMASSCGRWWCRLFRMLALAGHLFATAVSGTPRADVAYARRDRCGVGGAGAHTRFHCQSQPFDPCVVWLVMHGCRCRDRPSSRAGSTVVKCWPRVVQVMAKCQLQAVDVARITCVCRALGFRQWDGDRRSYLCIGLVTLAS